MTNVSSVDSVYKIFRQINRVPRPSHNEDRIALFLTRFAEKLGLEYQKDEANNVVIRKPATPGYEDAEPIVLLNHMDMVCVADDKVVYDPLHDSIQPIIEDGWMKAKGTSLGADNGIGLSIALAILQDDSIIHGPLELLATTNEEDGMTGAQRLSRDFIRGRKVINLDSEEYDSITVESAGARIMEIGMRARQMKTPLGAVFYDVTVSGGLGGHSGVDINKGRANVTLLLLNMLSEMNHKMHSWWLSSIEGGNAAASIPSKAVAHLVLYPDDVDKMKKNITSAFTKVKKPYSKEEKNLKLNIVKGKPVDDVTAPEDTIQFIDTMLKIPNGVEKMREGVPGLVQTSDNIGLVLHKKQYFDVLIHIRSFSARQMEGLCQRISCIFREQDAAMKTVMDAPAWMENISSPFIKLVDEAFWQVLGVRLRKTAMHFVLEAGYLLQKWPDMQIASIGPRIIEPHSPSERVELCTVEGIWKVTLEILHRLALTEK